MSGIVVALAGQPNCGKSTVFNGLTGAKQFVANYPGVTVDKMMGWYRRKETSVEVVDLPGTYSLTSYSPEERVSRDFLLHEKPSAVINVLDASNLKRSLYLTFQLLEMGIPLMVNMNMMDVAEGMGFSIDWRGLSDELGVPVVPTVMKTGKGKDAVLDAVERVSLGTAGEKTFFLEYPKLEDSLARIENRLSEEPSLSGQYPLRWLSVKLLEGDAEAARLVGEAQGGRMILELAESFRQRFEEEAQEPVHVYIAQCRYRRASGAASRHVSLRTGGKPSITGRLDALACHKVLGPIILLGVIYALYYLSIVQGYNLTRYTWPALAAFRAFIESLLPQSGFIDVPLIRSFVLWFVDSLNALLNYIPIFFILFGLIAVLEDSGYMPRMAFIMDRILSRFGLHGQSTLSMVLGGVVVGGCAVPGVMSCKGIPDERSRFATILTIPMLNCLAKVPLYILLINAYFGENRDLAMFFISTVSILLVLPVAKILSLTVLRKKERAPFIMEMPPYHLPTLRGILSRATERVWLYIRKITTVVAAVSILLFALLQFPGLSGESLSAYRARADRAVSEFLASVQDNSLASSLTEETVMDLVLFSESLREARMSGKPLDDLERAHPEFFLISRGRGHKDARPAGAALRRLIEERRSILLEMRQEQIENSLLGKMGMALEPLSRYAGFNWRVNVAILSSLAAKESSVATLGSLYQQQAGAEGASLEERMVSQEEGFTPLHALALMLFMVLCPPCIPAAIAVKVQTGSLKWMAFSFFYPLILGLMAAILVFSGGSVIGLSGLQAMWGFYGLALALTVGMGFVRERDRFSDEGR